MRCNGYQVPANFFLLSPQEQWKLTVELCDFSDHTSVLRVLNSPIPIESIKVIFPNAAFSGAFEDSSKITMELMHLRKLDETLGSADVEGSRSAKQLAKNNLRIKQEIRYHEELDDSDSKIHRRLFSNHPYTEPTKLFQSLATNNVKPVAHNIYKLSHINGAGCVTTRGWFEAHNLASTTISLKDFHRKNYVKTNSGAAKRWKSGAEGVDNVFECEITLDEIDDLGEFFEAWFMLRLIKGRACMIDSSLEPLDRFLSKNVYFMSSKDKPSSMNPGKFCAGFVDAVIQINGARFASGESFLTYNMLQDALKDYQMPLMRADNPGGGGGGGGNGGGGRGGRGGGRGGGAQRPSPGPSGSGAQPDSVCKFFNTEKGCNYSSGAYCEWNNKRYLHLCNVKENGQICRAKHTASKHIKK